MLKYFLTVFFTFFIIPLNLSANEIAFPGAEGFGALAKGGKGGTVYDVTTLEDTDIPGSLRWAINQEGPRIIRFKVDGTIQLQKALTIKHPFITIDGQNTSAENNRGITIRDYPINIQTHDVIIRYLRIRLGDYAVMKRVVENNWDRHQSSNDLDCINIHRSQNVIIDHVSAFWCTDEIISVTNSQNITIQWSILAEPLGHPKLHPYGNNHAYGANNSASTLSYHHNLFAHFVMRGPQFEANDMDKKNPFDAKFEAVNNIIYAYTKTGSRYRTGFEKPNRDKIETVGFYYHIIGNLYINQNPNPSEIEAHDAFGAEKNIFAYIQNNIGPHRTKDTDPQLSLVFTDTHGKDNLYAPQNTPYRNQISQTPLFTSTIPITIQNPQDAYQSILKDVGNTLHRDEHDMRIIQDVKDMAPTRILQSQHQVGGWPTYTP